MPNITTLPLELLLEIAHSLDSVDFCALAHTRLELSKSLLSSEHYCRELTYVFPLNPTYYSPHFAGWLTTGLRNSSRTLEKLE